MIDFSVIWDHHFSLAGFFFNNSYNSSNQMAHFEELYCRRCRSSIGWFDSNEMDSLDTNLIRDARKRVHMIQGSLFTTIVGK